MKLSSVKHLKGVFILVDVHMQPLTLRCNAEAQHHNVSPSFPQAHHTLFLCIIENGTVNSIKSTSVALLDSLVTGGFTCLGKITDFFKLN